MRQIDITAKPGFAEWRDAARALLAAGLPPATILWGDGAGTADLFGGAEPGIARAASLSVPKGFLTLAEDVCCHAAPDRFALLYRCLWRLTHGEKHLLSLKTDNDVLQLNAYAHAVRRDAYKIRAFLRFRQVGEKAEDRFVAWYEPEHYSLALSLPFFQTRFKNMTWTIMTPYLAAYWDREELVLSDNPDPAAYPQDDDVEKYWLQYYASIFNPARPKKQAMLNQMPKKYWKNMPEAALIKEMLQTSEAKTREMIARSEEVSR